MQLTLSPDIFRNIILVILCFGSLPMAVKAHDKVVTAYLTHCGGCHGIEGISGPTFVPNLRNTVGRFACSKEGREYLIRVPGVSMSLIRDDALLADVMNFVLFRLGGSSTPVGTQPYTADEIHLLRTHPVSYLDFMKHRSQILERSLQQCPTKPAQASAD